MMPNSPERTFSTTVCPSTEKRFFLINEDGLDELPPTDMTSWRSRPSLSDVVADFNALLRNVSALK